MRFLDTDIMIDFLRGYSPALEWFQSIREQEAPALPGYVVMELLTWQGIKNKAHLHQLYDILAEFMVYWPSSEACNNALASVYAKFLSHSVEPFDALIAECAKEYQATLCTYNRKHYEQIDGLVIEQPYTKLTKH
jgi:predicted nucleic acid-binding protein